MINVHTIRLCLVADRSVLAANMFRLLLAPLDIHIIHVTSLDEMRDFVRAERRAFMLVISSNAFTGHVEKMIELCEGKKMAGAQKIFVLRESEVKKGWKQRFEEFQNVDVIVRPFHPSDFLGCVKKSG